MRKRDRREGRDKARGRIKREEKREMKGEGVKEKEKYNCRHYSGW